MVDDVVGGVVGGVKVVDEGSLVVWQAVAGCKVAAYG